MKITDSRYTIIAIAPFLGDEPSEKACDPTPIAIENADQGLKILSPSLYLPLPGHLAPEGGIQLYFKKINDFTPDAIIEATPWLRRLKSAEISSKAMIPDDPISSLLDMVDMPDTANSTSVAEKGRGSDTEDLLSVVMQRILNSPQFRQLEAVWQGLELLTSRLQQETFKVYILPVTTDEACETLKQIFPSLNSIHPELLLLDLPFDSTPQGMKLLEAASGLAEQLMAPVACWCGHQFFQLDSWNRFNSLPYLPNHLEGFVYARWKKLKSSLSANWTAVCCNGLLYNPASVKKFDINTKKMIAPVWAFATMLSDTLQHTVNSNSSSVRRLSLDFDEAETETVFSEERVHQLLESGLLPLLPISGNMIGIPALDAIDGSPLKINLKLSKLIHNILELRKEYGSYEDGYLLANDLQSAFDEYHKTRNDTSAVTIKYTGIADRETLRLAITASFSANSTQRIEFTFDW